MTSNSFRNSVADALAKLATGEARTKSSRFREVFPEIEKAMKAGVSRKAILQALNQSGLDITMSTLDTNLRRARAKSKNCDSQKNDTSYSREPNTLPLEQPRKIDAAPDQVEAENVGSHDPAAIDKVLGARVDLEQLARHRKKK